MIESGYALGVIVVMALITFDSLKEREFANTLGRLCFILLCLALASRLPTRFFGVLSHSLLAAMGHLAGQLLLARLWLMPHDGVWLLLPPLMLSSLLGGIATGLLTLNLLQRLAPCPHPAPSPLP